MRLMRFEAAVAKQGLIMQGNLCVHVYTHSV
jgi:hypothetical protein